MHSLNDLVYVALLIGLWWVKLTFGLFRRTRYLEELVRREQQRSITRQNELLKTLATAFASGEPTTLDDLLSHAERDWSLKSSAENSSGRAPKNRTPR